MTFGVSEKGCSNEKLGLRWLKEVFDSVTKERFFQHHNYFIMEEVWNQILIYNGSLEHKEITVYF